MRETLSRIPLSALRRSKQNVRKTDRAADVEALAASIEVHGLIQNLTVRAVPGAKSPTYDVVAGSRRLAALRLLARKKRIAPDMKVPCRVLDGDASDATEVSLAENTLRVPLHPADQFEAFSKLQAEGHGPEAIAARFGITANAVLQRLKLAAVSPGLMAAYRDDKMTLDQLTAFAVSDDPETQERVWSEDPRKERPPHAIRRELTSALVEAGDRRARFVGAEAYEAAGGTILRDLFRPDDEGFFTDPELLDRLASQKLSERASTVHAEGWQWVEVRPAMDYEYLGRYGRVAPELEERSEEDRRRLNEISAEYDAMVAALDDEVPPETAEKLDVLEAEIAALSMPCERWAEEVKTQCGALVTIGHDGDLAVVRGLVRPDPKAPAKARKSKTRRNGKGDLPDGLRETLSAHRTAALRLELGRNPPLAFRALVHALVLQTFYGPGQTVCIDVRPTFVGLGAVHEELRDSLAVKAFAEERQRLRELLPVEDELWLWLSKQDEEIAFSLLAHCTASCVNALWRRNVSGDRERLAQADVLAAALFLDMTAWWRPTRVGFFDLVNKDSILGAVAEAVSKQAADNIAAMKKGPMAARAEELLVDKAWLPEPLRTSKAPESSVTAEAS